MKTKPKQSILNFLKLHVCKMPNTCMILHALITQFHHSSAKQNLANTPTNNVNEHLVSRNSRNFCYQNQKIQFVTSTSNYRLVQTWACECDCLLLQFV